MLSEGIPNRKNFIHERGELYINRSQNDKENHHIELSAKYHCHWLKPHHLHWGVAGKLFVRGGRALKEMRAAASAARNVAALSRVFMS